MFSAPLANFLKTKALHLIQLWGCLGRGLIWQKVVLICASGFKHTAHQILHLQRLSWASSDFYSMNWLNLTGVPHCICWHLSFLHTVKHVTTHSLPFYILRFVDVYFPLLFPHFIFLGGLKLYYCIIVWAWIQKRVNMHTYVKSAMLNRKLSNKNFMF